MNPSLSMTCDPFLSTRTSRKRIRVEDDEIFVHKRIIPSVSESLEKLSFQSDDAIQMPNTGIGSPQHCQHDDISLTVVATPRKEGPPPPLLRGKSKYVRQVDFLIDELIRNTRRKLQAAVPSPSDVDFQIPNTVGPDPRTDHSISAFWPVIPLQGSDSSAASSSRVRPSASSGDKQRSYRDEKLEANDSLRVSGSRTHADWFISNCNDDFANIDGSTATIGDETCKVCREKGRRSCSDCLTRGGVSTNCSYSGAKCDHPGTGTDHSRLQSSPCSGSSNSCSNAGRMRRSSSNMSVSSDGNDEDSVEEVLPDSPMTLPHSSDDDDCGTIIG